MSRLFDGTDDQMVYGSVPAAINVTGAVTLLVVARIVITTDATWLSFIECETSGGALSTAIVRSAFSGGIAYSNGGTLADMTTTVTDSDGWFVGAVGKATGTAAVTESKCVIGGSNTHEVDSSLASGASITGGTLRLGGNDDFANIRLAAAAIFTKQLTQSEINGINTAKTTQSIYDLTPVWLVDDNDAFVTDYMGNCSRTSVTGTADDADDPSGWVYGIGGAAAKSFPPVRRYRELATAYRM